MKSFVAIALLCIFAFASAEDKMEEEPRFGFLTLNNNGASLAFNSTSLQYAVIGGVILLVLALVVIPFLGFDLGNIFAKESFEDDYPYAYDNQGFSSYSSYAQRSLNMLSPILTALSEAYKKYE